MPPSLDKPQKFISPDAHDPYHEQEPEHQFLGVEERDEEKDDERGQDVVGLVVQQVVDKTVEPTLRILDIRNLESAKNSFS